MSNVSSQPLAHVHNQFEFDIAAPMKTAAPLFGPEGERVWAGDHWDPHFVYPFPPRDMEGAVFTVSHAHGNSVWVNTVFDLKNGHMQYVYYLSDSLVTLIDVRLSQLDENRTHVRVTYERTALKVDANEHVEKLGSHDASAGPEWDKSIQDYLNKQQPTMQP